jgi:carbonic anhydrase/acetyltransferase-like protein (isoleucine patch superfamily)
MKSKSLLLLIASLSLLYISLQAQNDPGGDDPHDIHLTAIVDPSVILKGKVTVGAYTLIDAGTVITGDVTIGHHTLIRCNVTVRGKVTIGNYTHIYDNACIESGRGRALGLPTTTNTEDEYTTIGDYCWVNHGATMHGTYMGDRSAVNLNACCDYGTKLGEGAVLANGSATHSGQVIPANSFAEGVPAVVTKENITDEDRQAYFGLIPAEFAKWAGDDQEKRAKQ